MNVRIMREELRRHFGAASPFSKRLDRMKDSQVIAIYYRIKNKGEIK